ncbi:MAG TPA: OB-fold domain-containing protein [Streptosporangiaceae bacterium]|nr:OB-fold domain-containing protein [Streptosporangiaceae bacterium]
MDARPAPLPDEVSAPYWEAARDGVLVVQTCRSCGAGQFPPDLTCHRCLDEQLDFEAVSGVGQVYSYAIYTRSFDEAFDVPYALALVDLADRPEVRLMTNIVGTPLDAITVGMTVEVTFEQRGAWRLPQFRPAAGAA